ncbi:YqiA/YcfP family alpha/beta fold hydrolase [Pseudomonas weihenstephanensis]|uniref:Esterase n=1 Tax=Pseudomonas weihenstephanensis TaxID=1608994 RepID=A0A0J6J3G0_9PSED|nr:YqiA/YcfP family alpha/beta fold hydrolase [Pseudomonas weihenstephanensis]KMN13559.1 esterase [Pseudomonas weihenstephanensis]KMN18968.1 esterase [Pseudomonas weihenstephanensis]MBM1192086.1 esterase [Pseudomonas weihenstephanensis]GLX90204.1 esterase [Pseudomonas fragi]
MSGSILYIHGFNSAPESKKATQLRSVMQQMGLDDRLQVPALHHHPRQALMQLDAAISELGSPLLVGSSLGGYYATYLAERHGLKALLVNPAVSPHRMFDGYLGTQTNLYSGQTWELTHDHVTALAELEVSAPQDPQRIQVWLQTADETLDYRHAEKYYAACALRIQAGGDHSYQGFALQLPALLSFAGIAAQQFQTIDFAAL